MDLIREFIQQYQLGGLEASLGYLAREWGLWLYLVLFLVSVCETGLVVTRMLPGDGLLFLVGGLAAGGSSQLSLVVLLVLLSVAVVAGDAVNDYLGYRIGPKVFKYEHSHLFNKKHH